MIIPSPQSAFIPSWIITYDIIIAQELLHTMKYNLRGKKGKMVIKLDMPKAYDHVKWSYLKVVL